MYVPLGEMFWDGDYFSRYSGPLTILVVIAMVLITLLILVPQLLRWQRYNQELLHAERMKTLEKGLPLPQVDERSVAAGRTASLVPMVVVCTAGTVTCFLTGYGSEHLFAVALAVWSVAGVVSLAAITGGVALMGRLAQLHTDTDDEEVSDNPLQG